MYIPKIYHIDTSSIPHLSLIYTLCIPHPSLISFFNIFFTCISVCCTQFLYFNLSFWRCFNYFLPCNMATQRLLAHCSYASWSIAALRSFVCTRGAGREGGGRWSERTFAEGYLVGCGCGDWATRCWQNSLRRRMSDISTLST